MLLNGAGRSLGVVPRSIRKDGYVDLELDDRMEGTLLFEMENPSGKLTHQTSPLAQQ